MLKQHVNLECHASQDLDSTILVVTTARLAGDAIHWINDQCAGQRVVYFSMDDSCQADDIPSDWDRVTVGDLADEAHLRHDLLAFVEEWPHRKILGSRTFNQLFTDSDGYPHWWMGPGIMRSTLWNPLLSLSKIWFLSRAREAVQPAHTLLYTEDRQWATIFASSFAESTEYDWVAGSVRPLEGRQPWNGRLDFIARSVIRVGNLLWKILRCALHDAWTSFTCRNSTSSNRPTIVATTEYPRHFRYADGQPQQWYWNHLAEELNGLQPESDFRLLSQPIHCMADPRLPKSPSKLKRTGLQDSLVIPGSPKLNVSSLIRLVCRHMAQLLLYFRLEATESFRSSFRFQGADVSTVYVPLIRRMLRGALNWELDVSSTAAALKSIGDVRIVLVHVEMYTPGMKVIAACRRLDIPTVGMQHGSIYPMHLVYTLPETQVREAPIPDFFACYGEFAGEVLSKFGRYPSEQLQIVGGPRLDHLVTQPPMQLRCRKSTGLPADKFVILVTASAITWEPNAVRHLLDAVSNDPGVCVCIKISPTGRGEETYRQLARKYSSVVDVRVYVDQIDELLNACDVLVSVVSTTILEASLLGKPTICLNYTGHPELYPFAREGLSLAANDAESMRQAVAEVKDPSNKKEREARRRRFLSRHVGPTLHGRAGETLARWIHDRFIVQSNVDCETNRTTNAA